MDIAGPADASKVGWKSPRRLQESYGCWRCSRGIVLYSLDPSTTKALQGLELSPWLSWLHPILPDYEDEGNRFFSERQETEPQNKLKTHVLSSDSVLVTQLDPDDRWIAFLNGAGLRVED